MLYEIKTERLLLRPLDISDLQVFHAYSSDCDNTKYMLFLPNNTIEETEAFLRDVTNEWSKDRPTFYEFSIDFEGTQVGTISVYLEDDGKIGELGWIIDKKHWRNGFAREAAAAVMSFAASTLRVEKIIAHCDYRNVASYSLMKKIGMTLESDSGTRTYAKNGETAQELMYSFTP